MFILISISVRVQRKLRFLKRAMANRHDALIHWLHSLQKLLFINGKAFRLLRILLKRAVRSVKCLTLRLGDIDKSLVLAVAQIALKEVDRIHVFAIHQYFIVQVTGL
jgi:hypothetical protein